MNAEYSQEAVMMTLAAISYRGFNLMLLGESERRTRLRAAMVDSINTLGPVRNNWDLVWGPASFRALKKGLDEVVLYVARSRHEPTTLVVAIRGTNPLSASDWILGNLTVSKTVPWPYGAPTAGAEISVSTALNLCILKHLRSDVVEPSSPAEKVSRAFRPDTIRRFVSRSLAGGITRPLDGLVKPLALAEWIDAAKRKQSETASSPEIQTLMNESNRLLPEHCDPLSLLIDGASHASSAPGIDLLGFLRNVVRESRRPVQIYVTGHSKGGALSSTVALWLADTQGGEPVPPEDQWDVNRVAIVHAYSFAGPTAGNGKFALHSNGVIGSRCWRVVNQQDIVPHVWSVNDIDQIPDLYPLNVIEHALLATTCATVLKSVEHLDYQQIGNIVESFTSALKPRAIFAHQVVHQHLQAYFDKMKLSNDMNVFTFFTPV